MNEAKRVTVCVVVRERFSTSFRCLDELISNTPEPYDLLVVFGGAPANIRAELEKRYGQKARFVFEKRLLNQAESRNIALRESKTELVAIIDNDVYVRPYWLEPLLRCLDETGAGFVVPMVLEMPTMIHTAGNDFFITRKNGKPHGHKVLRYAKITYFEDSNLKRARTDYGELHCQLLRVEPARRLHIFDERLHEQTEVDSGLTMAKGGYEMWFEPRSVVHFDLPGRITKPEDVLAFRFKWDTAKIVDSVRYFEEKWGIDISEGGAFARFVAFFNQKLGIWSRFFPSPAAVAMDELYFSLKRFFGAPIWAWRKIKDRITGQHHWQGR